MLAYPACPEGSAAGFEGSGPVREPGGHCSNIPARICWKWRPQGDSPTPGLGNHVPLSVGLQLTSKAKSATRREFGVCPVSAYVINRVQGVDGVPGGFWSRGEMGSPHATPWGTLRKDARTKAKRIEALRDLKLQAAGRARATEAAGLEAIERVRVQAEERGALGGAGLIPVSSVPQFESWEVSDRMPRCHGFQSN